MRICFITSTPWNIARGSGTFVGIAALAESLRSLGVPVDMATSRLPVPIYTLRRIVFNQLLSFRSFSDYDVTVGFDMDGYALSRGRRSLRVAAIKGVIADEMRFESGVTRATMQLQAACERLNVLRADLVVTTSEYSKSRIQELYGAPSAPRVVPELIDLAAWDKRLQDNRASLDKGKFVVLSVCRCYPRKRLGVLLKAIARLRTRIPGLELRIVGTGPEMDRLKRLSRELGLGNTVIWLGDVSQVELVREYVQCHVFCLPSVQEGFGIVFLEAMACSKPIVAVRAAATPEVVKHGLLVEPDNAQALADAIERLYKDPGLGRQLSTAGREFVKRFDSPLVARLFLGELKATVEKRNMR